MNQPPAITNPAFAGHIGVARRDVTPPVGIYHRNWGAATHDTAEGVHKPMLATVLTLQAAGNDQPLVLVAVDAGWYRSPDSEQFIRSYILEQLGLPEDQLMISLSHTHAAGSISLSETDKPGGHLIEPYVRQLRDAIIAATREALASATPATLTVTTGRCNLAINRDLPDPDPAAGRVICGYNPDKPADDTLLVGRVTRDDGSTLATLVNYACHPTTLAWDNRLISPDFVGAMRETIEAQTNNAPCLFLQGASGELSPRVQYTGDTQLADNYGSELGFAALTALTSMFPPKQKLSYQRVVESGAPLALWRYQNHQPPTNLQCKRITTDVPLKPELPSEDELRQQLETCTDHVLKERLYRKLHIVRVVGSGSTTARPAWIWQLGDIILVGQPDEAYSHLQRDLRAAFPDHAVLVMNVTNGSCGYLCPEHEYDRNIYQAWQTPFDRGCLEAVIASTRTAIRTLIEQHQPSPHTV